jgi:hypothetical protein
MASTLNTFDAIVGDVHAHALGVDSLLIEGWVRDVWDEIERARTWSYLRRQYQIVIPAPYTTGTATLTPGSTTVTIANGVVSESWIGRQFQRSTGEPIHEITSVDTSADTIEIFPEWNLTTTVVSAQGYKVFTAYIVPPHDFFCWISVRDTDRRRRLSVNVSQDTLDSYDPKRSHGSRPVCLSGVDWTRRYGGRVYSAIRVAGTGPTPVLGGLYNGQSDALLILTIALGGARDTATFTYATDSGAASSAQVVSSSGNFLPNGVSITWPDSTYILGAVYVARLSSSSSPLVPRYEIYPHPAEAMVLNATYSIHTTAIDADGFVIPMPITGAIVKLGALDLMARWPGTREKPNPFAQIGRSTEFRERFEDALVQCMTLDNYIIEQNITQAEDDWPLAGFGRSQTEDNHHWLMP